MKTLSQQRGYTLLFAVLTATLVLGVTVFILSVSKKQFALSNIARESMFAIYAADSGIECIALDNPNRSYPTYPIAGTFQCDGRSVTKSVNITNDYPASIDALNGIVYTSDFTLGFRNPGATDNADVFGCAIVKAYYYTRASDSAPGQAIITSRGYNLCSYSGGQYAAITTSPRTVERAMQLEYH